MDKLSVIMPMYNAEKTIRRCLDSFKNNDKVEVVIVNDCSKDNSRKIVEEYVGRFPDIFKLYDHEKNMGVGVARRTGIDNASSEWVTFCDADDEVHIEQLLRLYENVKSKNIMIGEGRFESTIYGIPFRFPSKKYGERIIDISKEKDAICRITTTFWSRVFKKDILKDYDAKVRSNEDVEVISYLMANVGKIYHTDDLVYVYHHIKGSVTSFSLNIKNVKTIENMVVSLNKLKEKFEKGGLYEKYKEEISALYIRLLLERAFDVKINLKIKNKKELVQIIVDILKVLVPNWKSNKYYKSKFKGFEWHDRDRIFMSTYKYTEYKHDLKENIDDLLKRYDEIIQEEIKLQNKKK